MPRFEDHFAQAQRNIAFLGTINTSVSDCFDWQVTAAFYASLHLVNAHLATKGLQYRTHNDVKDALNPFNQLALGRLPEDEYTAYVSLLSLSRRSRYLFNEKDPRADEAAFTHEVHLARSLRHLNTLLSYFCGEWKVEIPAINIECARIRQGELAYFKRK